MSRDFDNKTFLSDTEKVYSEQGQLFHREKYLPKLNRVKKYLPAHATEALDVGIGYGAFMTFTEQELALTSHGLDPFPESISIAKKYTQSEIQKGRIEDKVWPYQKKFDFISCLDVTEHLEDPNLFYLHAKEYLKPNGVILMTTPLRLFPYEMRSWPIIGIPDMNTTHINVQPPKYWDDLAHKNGYKIVDSWYGEHLTHLKWVPGILRRLCNATGINPQTSPIIRSFQQAYNQIIVVK